MNFRPLHDRVVVKRIESEETNRDRYGRNERTYFSVKLPLRAADGSIYALCGISTDITEHKKNLEQIHQLAYYDALTGLPNRRAFDQAIAERTAVGTNSAFALMFIDADDFKQINDRHGHDVGDAALAGFARRARAGSSSPTRRA